MANSKINNRTLLFDANPLILKKTGIGYFVENILTSMAKNKAADLKITGHYFNFLGKKSSDHLPGVPQIKYRASRLVPTKMLGLLRRAGIQLPFELFARKKADVTFFTNYVSMPTIFKTINVLFVYDLSFIDCPQFVSKKNGAYLKKWVPISIKRADKIVTISNFAKQRIIELFSVDPEKIYITPIPPTPHSQVNPVALENFGINKDYILFVGTLEPRKNIITLLEAYEKLPANLQQNVQLVLAGGSGWNDQEIIAKLDELKSAGKQIVATGYIDDSEKAVLYKNAKFCIQPSHYEGFGMPILEAMSYGKAVLCSDIEVFREIAGSSAEYFKVDSSSSLSNAISDFLNNPEKLNIYSELSAKLVQNYPSWDKVASDLYSFVSVTRKH